MTGIKKGVSILDFFSKFFSIFLLDTPDLGVTRAIWGQSKLIWDDLRRL
jgi:hypothetical protein